jgi:hypothetical protein
MKYRAIETRFSMQKFLNRFLDKGGDVTNVFYVFPNSNGGTGVRQITSYHRKYGTLKAVVLRDNRSITPDRSFSGMQYDVSIDSYPLGGSRRLIRQAAVLISLYDRGDR